MKLLTLQQQTVSAGSVDSCVYVTDAWKESDNQTNGYVFGTIIAVLAGLLADELLNDVFATIGLSIIGGTTGYILEYGLSSTINAAFPNNQWHCFY